MPNTNKNASDEIFPGAVRIKCLLHENMLIFISMKAIIKHGFLKHDHASV